MGNAVKPTVSVVVAIVSDTTGKADTRHLKPCLAALMRQIGPELEIIVPYHAGVGGMEEMRADFPEVEFVNVTHLRTYTGRLNSREHHDEIRARGMALARGEIVALIEDHGVPTPEWSSRIVEAHRQSFAGVGGAIENAVDRPLNWAVFLCDFGRYQNPLRDGESTRASDANVSYKREALEAIRPVWIEEFHESSVNAALMARGEKLALASGVVVHQHRHGLRLGSALRERFVWGRSFGALRGRQAGTVRRTILAIFSPALPLLMTYRMGMMATRKGYAGVFVRALPLISVLTAAWACGELAGYLTGRAHSATEAAETMLPDSGAAP